MDKIKPAVGLLKSVGQKVSNAFAGMKGHSVAHVMGVFGVPRSGTTLLTALIDAHSKAACVYEPWHSKRLRLEQTKLDDLMALVRAQGKELNLVCYKETATKLYYLTNIDNLLDDASRVSRVSLVWIVRSPMDAFLSQIAADHRWRKGLFNPNPSNFKYWAGITYATFLQMSELLKKYQSCIVFYDNLTAHPERVLKDVMSMGGLEFESEQLNYHDTINRKAVRGDRFVIDEARPVLEQSKEKYAQQIMELKAQYSDDEYLSYLLELSDEVRRNIHHGVLKPPHPAIKTLIDCARENYIYS